MNITLEISPEVQAALAQQAAMTGRPLEVHAASLLKEAVHLPAAGEPASESLDQMFAKVRGLFEDGELDFRRDPSPDRSIDLS